MTIEDFSTKCRAGMQAFATDNHPPPLESVHIIVVQPSSAGHSRVRSKTTLARQRSFNPSG